MLNCPFAFLHFLVHVLAKFFLPGFSLSYYECVEAFYNLTYPPYKEWMICLGFIKSLSLADLVEDRSVDDWRISSEFLYTSTHYFPVTSALTCLCSAAQCLLFCPVFARSCVNSCYQSVLALKSLFFSYDAKGCSKKNGKGKSEWEQRREHVVSRAR